MCGVCSVLTSFGIGRVGESGEDSGVSSVVTGCDATGLSGTESVAGRPVEQAHRIKVQKRSGQMNLFISLRRVVNLLCSKIKRAGYLSRPQKGYFNRSAAAVAMIAAPVIMACSSKLNLC